MSEKLYVLGIDYGTDSVRAIVVDSSNGAQVAEGLSYYKRWKQGVYCDASTNQFRQHPLDYIESLEESVREALKGLDAEAVNSIKAIAVDTTGSTPCPVDMDGCPLALREEFKDNPNAMFVLWKDHTSVQEALEINKLAHSKKFVDYTKYVGGIYSSEWFWAKLLHISRIDPKVYESAYSWVEHCDYIPAMLTGNTNPKTMKRFRCSAGHKAMWNEEFDGLPSEEFLVALDPLLKGMRERLYTHTFTSDIKVGTITQEWATRLGVPQDVVIAGGALDAHFGAVGGGIENLDMVKVIGTSTCDIVIASYALLEDKLIRGICGQVDGSVVPGYIGLEAGQSAFGDVYSWFAKMLIVPMQTLVDTSTVLSDALNAKQKEEFKSEISEKMIVHLNERISELEPVEDIVALDWINGRRTPDANQLLKGGILGLDMGTDMYHIYRALVESTAFGARSIQERFLEEGIAVKRVIAIGGVARKSSLIMQILADVLNRRVYVSAADQACALGSAMFAAVAAGIYTSVEDAQKQMSTGFDREFSPRPKYVEIYNRIYEKYKKFGTFVEANTKKMK